LYVRNSISSGLGSTVSTGFAFKNDSVLNKIDVLPSKSKNFSHPHAGIKTKQADIVAIKVSTFEQPSRKKQSPRQENSNEASDY